MDENPHAVLTQLSEDFTAMSAQMATMAGRLSTLDRLLADAALDPGAAESAA
ncbi:hypothetical protein H7H37_24150, partial [Mycolicibacterium insubricum]|nr:hypothetical protein [Mycolicibacterium insubricum]